MTLNQDNDSFEEFRREKRMRSLHRELRTRMESRQGQIMRMIDAKERDEILEKQIQREMDEFFSESTALAAEVLGELANEKAKEVASQINREMRDFFKGVLSQAQTTVNTIQSNSDGKGIQNVEPHMDNALVTEFGGHGTPEPELTVDQVGEMQLDEKEAPAENLFIPEPGNQQPEEEPASENFLDVKEEFSDPQASADKLIQTLSDDPAKLKKALTTLFQAGIIDREQAREIYLEKQGKKVNA